MRTLNPKASAKYPSSPVSRLVGHEGPVQTVCFTSKFANLIPYSTEPNDANVSYL